MKYIERLAPRAKYGDMGATDAKSTPDGGFLYITMQGVAYIKINEKENPLIKIFNTKQPVIEIDIDSGWCDKEKLFAVLTMSNSVLIFDLDKNIAISGHSSHCPSKPVEGRNGKQNAGTARMSFMKNRNLMSITTGELIIYCIASNSTLVRSNFMNLKGQIITVLQCSPYDENIFACGTNRGAVIVCDLQRSCNLFTFDGHANDVISLSWNAVDFCPVEKKLTKCPAVSSTPDMQVDGDDIFNIYDYDYLENEFGAPIQDEDADVNASIPNETEINELSLDPNFNFNEACENLKQEITALSENKNIIEPDACDAVTLDDCLPTRNLACTSSIGSSNESTEGSLKLLELSSSGESCHVDGNDVTLTERGADLKAAEQLEKPVKTQQNNEKPNFDVLLLSTSRDGKCYIRNITTGSFCDQIKKSAKNLVASKSVWTSQTEMLVLSTGNVIRRRKLVEKKFSRYDTVRAYKLETDDDESLNFVAVGEVAHLDQALGSDLLWYITANHKIVCINSKTREIVLYYDTITTSISNMCESPENSLKIAFTLASNGICLMNAMDLTPFKITFDNLPVRLLSAIKSIAWHANGYDLAYGTLKGNVGVINVDLRKHTTFDLACGRVVYSIAWYCDLIVCICQDKVYAYKMGLREPLKLDGLHNYYSSVAAYEKYLILGTSRGQIHVFQHIMNAPDSLSFLMVQSLDLANHYITGIVFNPLEIEQFAVVANEAYVYVLKFDAQKGAAKLTHKLNCGDPHGQIHNVKWSNRQKDKLIGSGFDGDLRIFDLSQPSSQEMIFSRQFYCPILSAMFLPSDERYVLCTGKSMTVEIIDTEKPNSEIYQAQSRSLNGIKWATQTIVNTSAGGGASKRKRNKQLNKALINADNAENQAPLTDDLIEKLAEVEIGENGHIKKIIEKTDQQKNSSFLKNPQTALSLITKEQNKNPLLKIHDFVTLPTFKEKREAVLMARLFGQKIDAQKLLAAELANIKSTGSSVPDISTLFLNQLNGGLRAQILDAIQNRQLREWHVSVAPSISYSMWKKCSEAYAEQLMEQGHPLQAAVYLLGLNKQVEAIGKLVDAKYFKEAMLIGRVYLQEKDPLLDDIRDKWVDYLERDGNLHAAALICTVSQQYKRGSEILSKQRVAGPEIAATIQLLKENAH